MKIVVIKLNLLLLILFFTGAGINHFWHPVTNNIITPPYIPFRSIMVELSGIIEICLGLLFIFRSTRKIASIGIILLLIAVTPVHIYMIQMHGCVTKEVCIPEWLAWIRLFLQFILIWWVRKTYKWSIQQPKDIR